MNIPGIHLGLSDKQKADIVRSCGIWWDMTGRHLVNKAINEYTPPPKVRAGKGAPIMVVKHADEKDLNNGILLGRKWDDLTPAEKVAVVQSYIQHKVIPDRSL
jgi:hypothetical protein